VSIGAIQRNKYFLKHSARLKEETAASMIASFKVDASTAPNSDSEDLEVGKTYAALKDIDLGGPRGSGGGSFESGGFV
jgi:hypothetical protein